MHVVALLVANLTDLSEHTRAVIQTSQIQLSKHRGKALCHPRDLVSQPLVVVGVVQEGYAH